jgi:hypothetical protein
VLHESSERRCAIGSGSDPLQAQHLDDLPTRDDRALMHGWTAEKYRRFDRGERMPPDWKPSRHAAS